VNEMQVRDIVSNAILAQEGDVAYLIFDQGVRESLASIETYASQGILTQEESVALLASDLDIPANILEQTLEKYNNAQKSGVDDDFGRSAEEMPRALVNSPFYAICVTPAIHHTMGGIRVDAQMHALTSDGQIIPGLFAAGEVTGGLHGGNRLGGNGVADVVVNGRIAGTSAAEFLK